eukprot:jgi/Botrbrau1/21975/Bobra.0514s0002.1
MSRFQLAHMFKKPNVPGFRSFKLLQPCTQIKFCMSLRQVRVTCVRVCTCTSVPRFQIYVLPSLVMAGLITDHSTVISRTSHA